MTGACACSTWWRDSADRVAPAARRNRLSVPRSTVRSVSPARPPGTTSVRRTLYEVTQTRMPPRIAPSVWRAVMVGRKCRYGGAGGHGNRGRRSTMDDATADYLRRRYWEEDDLLRDLREDLQRRGPTLQGSAATGPLPAGVIAPAPAPRVPGGGTALR